MLVQSKTFKIGLSNEDRVKKVIGLTYQSILVIKKKSLEMMNIYQNQLIWTLSVENLSQHLGCSSQQINIIEAIYQPFLSNIFILLSFGDKQKHENWKLYYFQFPFSMPDLNNFNPKPVLVDSYENSKSKYGQMQLKPRLIAFSKSSYFVLLREFYSDSMIVVIKGHNVSQRIYLNQQNLSPFDTYSQLVCFRSQFKDKIQWREINIQKFNKEDLSRKKNIPVDDGGALFTVKKLQFPTNREFTNKTLLAVNWRNKTISYLLYDQNRNEVMINIKDSVIPDSIILSYFYLKGSKICTMQRVGRKEFLVFEDVLNCQGNKNSFEKRQKNFHQINFNLQQWDVYPMHNNQFLICNYAQFVSSKDQIQCSLFREANKKEMVVQLLQQLKFSENIYKLVTIMKTQ